MASCHSHVDVMVAMAVPAKRPGVGVNWGRLIVIWGVSFPCKDLAISANLGGGVHFHSSGLPRGVDTCCVNYLTCQSTCWG